MSNWRNRFRANIIGRAHGWPAARFAIHYGVIMWAIPSALIFSLVGAGNDYVKMLLVTLVIFIPGGYFYGMAIRRRIHERIPPPGSNPQ